LIAPLAPEDAEKTDENGSSAMRAIDREVGWLGRFSPQAESPRWGIDGIEAQRQPRRLMADTVRA